MQIAPRQGMGLSFGEEGEDELSCDWRESSDYWLFMEYRIIRRMVK